MCTHCFHWRYSPHSFQGSQVQWEYQSFHGSSFRGNHKSICQNWRTFVSIVFITWNIKYVWKWNISLQLCSCGILTMLPEIFYVSDITQLERWMKLVWISLFSKCSLESEFRSLSQKRFSQSDLNLVWTFVSYTKHVRSDN